MSDSLDHIMSALDTLRDQETDPGKQQILRESLTFAHAAKAYNNSLVWEIKTLKEKIAHSEWKQSERSGPLWKIEYSP